MQALNLRLSKEVFDAVKHLLILGILAIFVGVVGKAEAVHLNVGLIGYWKFDEGTGQTANDSSSSDNDGTLGANSSVASDDPTWSTGKAAGGLDFDGIDDRVQVPSNSSIEGMSALTLSAWINPDASAETDHSRIVSKQQGAIGDDYHITYSGTGGGCTQNSISFRINTALGVTLVCATKTIAPNSGWHHVAGTWDGTNMIIYIDGTQEATGIQGGALDDSNNPLSIGYHLGGTGTRDFHGKIDEVRIYNRVLSATEILDLMRITSGIFESATFNALSQVAFNRFDASVNIPINTNVAFQIAVKPPIAGSCTAVGFAATDFVGPDGTSFSYFQTADTTGIQVFRFIIPYNVNTGQCFRYRVYMETVDPLATAFFYDITVNYSQ